MYTRFRSRLITAEDCDSYIRLVKTRRPLTPSQEAEYRKEYAFFFEHAPVVGIALETISRDPSRPHETEVIALMCWAFVNSMAIDQIIQTPTPGITRNLLAMAREGMRPFPIDEEMARLNRESLLNVVVMTYEYDATNNELDPVYLQSQLVNRFADRFAGYRIRRLIHELRSSEVLQASVKAGMRIVNSYNKFNESLSDSEKVYLIELDKEMAYASGNFFLIRLFCSPIPILGFNDAQVAILSEAVFGLTDLEIADRLGVSHEAVKKRWQSVYDRVQRNLPGLLPPPKPGSRGTEKRRVLLTYLQEHPEELLPQ